MRDTDFPEFSTLLEQTHTVLAKQKPDAQASALWFRALVAYDIAAVRAGFDGHIRDTNRGRFAPTPADIIAKINARDGRPSSDEAWAIAVKGADESASVTWNDDIAEAWGIALPVWNTGDEVGARMAFKDAYNRITRDRQGTPVRWWASLGNDPTQREASVQQGVAAGFLTHEAALMLQAPDSGTLERVANNAPPAVRASLLALRDKLAAKPTEEYVPNPDQLRTAELKEISREKYEASLRAQGFDPGEIA